MATCIVCNNDVTKVNIKIGIGGTNPPHQKGDVMANLCPSCGVVTLIHPESQYFQYLDNGFPATTQDQVDSLDPDQIIDEMELPGLYVGENLKWVNPSDLLVEEFDPWIESEFADGLPAYGKYYRLINFLLIDKAERDAMFGPLRCPTIAITQDGLVIFKEGRRRMVFLRFLGATRIPISITDESLKYLSEAGLTLYDSKE